MTSYVTLTDRASIPTSYIAASSALLLQQLTQHAQDASRLGHYLAATTITETTPAYPIEQDFRRLAGKLGLECYADDAVEAAKTLSMTGNMLVIDVVFEAGKISNCSAVLATPDGSQEELPAGQVLLRDLQAGKTTLAAVNLERLARIDRFSSKHGVSIYAQHAALCTALQQEIPSAVLDGGHHVGISVQYLQASHSVDVCYTATLELEEHSAADQVGALMPEMWRQADGQWNTTVGKRANALRYVLALDPPVLTFQPPVNIQLMPIKLEARSLVLHDREGHPVGMDVSIMSPPLYKVSRWPIAHPSEMHDLLQGPLRVAAVQAALVASVEASVCQKVDRKVLLSLEAGKLSFKSTALNADKVSPQPQEQTFTLDDRGSVVGNATRSSRVLEATYNLPLLILDWERHSR